MNTFAMTFAAQRLTSMYLVLWVLDYSVCWSSELHLKASAKNVSYVIGENGTVGTPKAGLAENFPPLNFYLKGVKTIYMEKVNYSSSLSPNISSILDLDAVIEGLDEVINGTRQENISELNYETLWENGSRTLTLVELQPLPQNATETPSHVDTGFSVMGNVPTNSNVIREGLNLFLQPLSSRRLKRTVFGSDDRVQVTDHTKHPYSAMVRISTGCSGTLISTYHVLTAAHCVHDGMFYRVNVNDLKVAILRKHGKVRWIRAQYMKIPRGWTLARDFRYDYAVIGLRHPHGLLPLGIFDLDPKLSVPIRGVQVASFPADKPENTLWRSSCRAHLVEHAILNRCDSNYGSSGAGIYMYWKKSHPKVIGVFSGFTNRVRFGGKQRKVNVGIKITPLKLAQIEFWMRSYPRKHNNALIYVSGRKRMYGSNRYEG